MAQQDVEFSGSSGTTLAGIWETPDGPPRGQVLFAHCFTGSKDVFAASRISRRLAELGFEVLRFDFTGLGDSEGDFADTNFSSNVGDLLCAAEYMKAEHRTVDLLVGHSLGGAAVLAAAAEIPDAQAVVTISAPADPDHVIKLFASSVEAIEQQGQAEVELAGRPFVIKKQFLDDLDGLEMGYIRDLGRPLLIYHSPVDQTVSIHEAADIYNSARHPKSFVSLNEADHLLTGRDDANYVAETLSAWVTPYLPPVDGGTN